FGVKYSKWKTSRLGIESSTKTCITSRIHLMSIVFHRWQTWDIYAVLIGRLARHGHHKSCPVNSKYVRRTVSCKKRTRPLSKRHRGISYALGDASMLYKAVAIVIGRIGRRGSYVDQFG
ncbi:UNVERIFIED_CONTAM: hypothetical protein Sindi_0717300, partial [Sesamum indicum]